MTGAVPNGTSSATPRTRDYLFVAATALIVYARTLRNGFVLDDRAVFVNHMDLRHWGRFLSLFTQTLCPLGALDFYYRPIQSLSFVLDYRIHGLSALGCHLTNLLLHAGCACLVLKLGTATLANRFAALLGAILFAVHPATTETVAWISCRSYLLATLFSLLTLLRLTSATRRFDWGSFALSLLAYGSNEGAAVLPFLALVAVAWKETNDDGNPWHGWMLRAVRAIPLLASLALYVALRTTAVGLAAMHTNTTDTPLFLRLLTMTKSWAIYFGLLLLPIRQSISWGIDPVASAFDPKAIGSITILVIPLLAVVLALRKKLHSPLFGALWLAAAMLPYSNIIPSYYLQEHWLYLALPGWCLAIGSWIALARGKRWAFAIAAIYLVALGGLTIRRTADWRDDEAVYRAVLPFSPADWIILGKQALQERDRKTTKGIPLEPLPREAEVHRQLEYALAVIRQGDATRARGDVSSAIQTYVQALSIDPLSREAYVAIGRALSAKGSYPAAERALRTAIRLDPEPAETWNDLGNAYFREGDLREARFAYEEAIRRESNLAEAHQNLGSTLFRLGDRQGAIRSYRRALELNPSLEQTKRNLAIAESTP